MPGFYLEDLCFDAQQAAEKAVKAVLIAYGVDFPHTHDLAGLFTLLEHAGQRIPPSVSKSTLLTPYAVTTRYPRIAEPISREEYEQSVAAAAATVSWAEQQVAVGRGETYS